MTSEVVILRLAREVAMDIHPIRDVLKAHSVSEEQWQEIQNTSRFQHYLSEARAQWETALNTAERVKVKAMAILEEWLVELDARIHDPKENLTAKLEGGKLLAKLGGLGEKELNNAMLGERFKLVINIGNSTQTMEHKVPTIEGTVENV